MVDGSQDFDQTRQNVGPIQGIVDANNLSHDQGILQSKICFDLSYSAI
jgi:hypothetical protein